MDNLSGVDRAAIFLLTLGEQEAAEILKHMGAKEVQRIGAAMAKLNGVTRDAVSAVIAQFTASVEEHTSLGVGADDFLRKVLVNALGEDRAATIIDRISIGRTGKGLEALKWMDARAIAEVVRLEHPQIVAIVLAYLDSDQAAAVLGQLPEALRSDVVLRIATLDGVQPSALLELDEIMEKQFSGSAASKTSVLGGPKAAADILNFLESSSENAIIEDLRRNDESLAQRIQDLIFVFDDLVEIDDRGMQELLRQVPGEQLLLALKAADEAMKAKVFRNMSQRAAEMLRDDLESKGPVKLSEVEGAQKEILTVARRLAEEGTLSLGGKDEQYV